MKVGKVQGDDEDKVTESSRPKRPPCGKDNAGPHHHTDGVFKRGTRGNVDDVVDLERRGKGE